MWKMLITVSGEQVCPDLIDVSGSHSYHQISFSAICQNIFFDFFKSGEIQAVAAQAQELTPRVSVSLAA